MQHQDHGLHSWPSRVSPLNPQELSGRLSQLVFLIELIQEFPWHCLKPRQIGLIEHHDSHGFEIMYRSLCRKQPWASLPAVLQARLHGHLPGAVHPERAPRERPALFAWHVTCKSARRAAVAFCTTCGLSACVPHHHSAQLGVRSADGTSSTSHCSCSSSCCKAWHLVGSIHLPGPVGQQSALKLLKHPSLSSLVPHEVLSAGQARRLPLFMQADAAATNVCCTAAAGRVGCINEGI